MVIIRVRGDYVDARVINNIKGLAVDMNSVTEIDNIDMSLATANILYVLYLNHLVVNNNDDKWINRDRLVVSNETGSALLYATLYMAGYNLTIDDLKNFAKQGFKTPAYPELNITPGVDASVGLPGQGIATAVGMALAGKMQNKLTTFNNQSLIDYNVYALCTDHDLMEGVALEALSMAGNLKLDNFILLYQANEMIASDDVSLKLKAMGFDTIKIKDVNDLKGISRAIHKAKLSSRPTVIEYRVLFQDKVKLNKENIDQLKLRFHQPGEPFISDNEARDYFRREIMTRCSSKYNRWSDNYRKLIDNKLPINTNISWLLGQNINLDLSKINIEIDDDFKEP